MELWTIEREDTEYQTPIFSLHKRVCVNPENGEKGRFYVLKCPDWVNVVAETEDGKIVLVEQYRHGINALSLEIPGGVIDEGEDPLTAALRELEEETGYVAESVEKIGTTSANAAIMNNYAHTYWAKNCRLMKKQQLDEHEQIRVSTMTKQAVLGAVSEGKIHHSIVVAALGMFFARNTNPS